jgi:iron complex outermembrane recepter protein
MEVTRSWTTAMLRCVSAHPAHPGSAPRLTASAATAAVALLIHPGITRAAETPGAEATGAETIQEVIVTAERREERNLDVPISTAVLSGPALQVLGTGGQDIRQLAFAVPSLNIESSNGRTFPRFYIRGYGNTDFTTFASQPVGLYYDDIVQENPELKGFPIFDQADVEVLRGPQGTLFGRNSPAGVVKLESAKPVIGQFSGYATVSDGTYDTANVEAVANVPINEQMAFRASGQLQHRDNWVSAPHNPAGNQNLEGYDDAAVRLQLLYKPSDSLSALFNVHGRTLNGSARLFRGNVITPGTNSLVPGFDPATIYTDGANGQSFSSLGANARLTLNTAGFTYQSITGYESIRHYNTQGDIDGGYGAGFFADPCVITTPNSCASHWGPGFIPFGVETSEGIKSHYQLTQEFRAVSNQAGPLQGQAGIFLFYENVEDFSNDYNITGSTLIDTVNSRQKNDAEAVFGSLEYAFTPAFKLRAGLRFTWDNKSFTVPFHSASVNLPAPLSLSSHATKLSWDVSPTYQLTPDANLYARIATGFRAPSFSRPSTLPPTSAQQARSEDNISYEVGIKADILEHRARVAFDIYYFDVSHQQLTAVGGNAVGGFSNVINLINAKDTIGKGAELDFEARLTRNLLLTVSGSYNYTRIDDPNLAVGPCFNWSFLPGGAACTELSPVVVTPSGSRALINGDPLPQAPKWVGDLSLRYNVPVPFGPSAEVYFFTDMSYRTDMNFFLDKELEFVGPSLFQFGARIGYTWSDQKYEVAVFCRNCTDQVRNIGGINFENFTGFINDPRILGGQLMMRF